MDDYEILEHTADVGLRARADTLEDTFELATKGLLEIMGAYQPGPGSEIAIEIEAADNGALLVDWLSEVLYLHDARNALITKVSVRSVENERARGVIGVAEVPETGFEGTQVKAVTYHQLRVEHTGDGWVAEVFFDI